MIQELTIKEINGEDEAIAGGFIFAWIAQQYADFFTNNYHDQTGNHHQVIGPSYHDQAGNHVQGGNFL